jgi:hypothetical protein
MKYIITIENLAAYRPTSKQIPADRINPYIQEAQQFDLKRLLGDPLYLDFLNYYDNTAAQYEKYRDLLNGKQYTIATLTYDHPGLIGFLCYMTLARFYNNNQVNATKYGLVTKLGEGSEPLDWKAIATAVAELRSNATALTADIIRYIVNNSASFPLFNQVNRPDPDLGVRFFDPDDINAPGPGSGRTLNSL